MPDVTIIPGLLQIDHNRGVVYFHGSEDGACVLRICRLPTPIPEVIDPKDRHNVRMLDVMHMRGTDWGAKS